MSGICSRHRYHHPTCELCNYPTFGEWRKIKTDAKLKASKDLCCMCNRKQGIPRSYTGNEFDLPPVENAGIFCDLCWDEWCKDYYRKHREQQADK